MKELFDKKEKGQTFHVGDLVKKWDKWWEDLGKHIKFKSFWLGPFIIDDQAIEIAYTMSNIQGETLPTPINGWVLKFYHRA